MRTVVSEFCAGGVKMQNVVYQWRKDQVLSDSDSCFTLKYLREHRGVRAAVMDQHGAHRIGRVVLTPPDASLDAAATDDEPRQRSTIFFFADDLAMRMLRTAGDGLRLDDVEADIDLRDAGIDAALVRLGNEMARPRLASTGAIEALVQLLFVDIARHVREEQEVLGASRTLSVDKLEHIKLFVAQSQVGWPTPAMIAAECGMSQTHLRRLFKRETGQTLQEFLIGERIVRARRLLRETEMPLKAISFQLGFRHCSAFTTAFRDAVGETPARYRKLAMLDA